MEEITRKKYVVRIEVKEVYLQENWTNKRALTIPEDPTYCKVVVTKVLEEKSRGRALASGILRKVFGLTKYGEHLGSTEDDMAITDNIIRIVMYAEPESVENMKKLETIQFGRSNCAILSGAKMKADIKIEKTINIQGYRYKEEKPEAVPEKLSYWEKIKKIPCEKTITFEYLIEDKQKFFNKFDDQESIQDLYISKWAEDMTTMKLYELGIQANTIHSLELKESEKEKQVVAKNRVWITNGVKLNALTKLITKSYQVPGPFTTSESIQLDEDGEMINGIVVKTALEYDFYN